MKHFVTLDDVNGAADKLINNLSRIEYSHPLRLYGVPRGGIPAAYVVANRSAITCEVTYDPDLADVIIDDIIDSGATKQRYAAQYPHLPFLALFDKQNPPWHDKWLVMPWEHNEVGSADDIIIRLLQYIGEDPTREGLINTPKRVLHAWSEWASGYKMEPAEILATTFRDGAKGYDEFVIVNNVPVISKCEHHLSDIIGIAHVGYIPDGGGSIVGISKLARLVECFARRLTVQERMTVQIVEALMEYLRPLGAGCVIRAAHSCMSTRGVKIHNSLTTTSAMRGVLMDKPEARKEFFDLCAMAEQHTNA